MTALTFVVNILSIQSIMFPVIYSDDFLQHQTGSFHPEQPQRLTAIKSALQQTRWKNQIDWRLPTSVSVRDPLDWIAKVHDRKYINEVRTIAANGGGSIDPDTLVSPQTYDVALLAVNAWLDGVETVMGTGEPAFVLARPPGHHADPDGGMGFCIFSNAAIAATYALSHGAARVAILDWDVHHGNGTQTAIAKNPQIAYCSLHEFPHYPGTGRAEDTGEYGNILNLPMTAGSTISDYQPLFENKVMPFLTKFQPDLLIVSAGYDANRDDPLANILLQPEDFGIFTDYCLKLTRKIVFGLEGGYDFNSLGKSVVATIDRCLNV
jgi:acetoin utilization deacetylase AcuC-like enzyme